MKYIDAHAACSPAATAWRSSCSSRPTADVFQCALLCGQVAELLIDAATKCSDGQDRTALWRASTWAVSLTLRLNEIGTYAESVVVCTPYVRSPGLPALHPEPSLNALSSGDRLGAVAVAVDHVGRCAEAFLVAGANLPHEVRQVAQQLIALQRWVSAPSAPC